MAELSPETIAIVKSTAPVLKERGLEITELFYSRLMQIPEAAALFDRAAIEDGSQPKRLAGAILAYAQNIDRLDLLGGAVGKIAHSHVAHKVKPEHYPIVGGTLLPAIRDVLGEDVATDAVIEAWGEAYGALAEILIGVEKDLYAGKAA